MMSTEICEEVSAQAGTETASTTSCRFETYRWNEAPGDFAPHGVICRNDPSGNYDMFGLWSSLEQNSDSDWMTIKADQDADPVGPLAWAIGLESGQAFGRKGWLKTASGRTVGSISDIRAGAHYRLPNKVFVMSGYTAWVRYLRLARQEMAYKTKMLGFKVIEIERASKSDIIQAFNSDYVFGVATFSHGEGGAVFAYGMPSETHLLSQPDPWEYMKQWTIEPDDVSINYRLSFVYVFACESGRGDWGRFVSRNRGDLVTYQRLMGVENMLWEGYDPVVQWRARKFSEVAERVKRGVSAVQSSRWLQMMTLF